MDYPNVRAAIAENVALGIMPEGTHPPLLTGEFAWVEYCKHVSLKCKEYFFENVLHHEKASMFEAAGLANPDFMRRKNLTAAEVRHAVQCMVGKLISAEDVNIMVNKLTAYKALAATRNWEYLSVEHTMTHVTAFWMDARKVPRALRKIAHLCFLLQPSSAAVERAFSFLKYIYDEQSSTNKQDLIGTTLKLRYNTEKRRAAIRKLWAARELAAAAAGFAIVAYDDDESD